MRARTRTRSNAVLLAVALWIGSSARALNVTAITVETNPNSCTGPGWVTVTPAVNALVNVGDWIRLTITLENDSGMLGHMWADGTDDPNSPSYGPGFGPQYDCTYHNNPGEYPDQYWVWPIFTPGCPASIDVTNLNAPVSFCSATPVVTFDYNGLTYLPGAPNETETVTWVYKAERPAAGVDFRIFATGGADDTPTIQASSDCSMTLLTQEGSCMDCSCACVVSDGTLGAILGTFWGGAAGNSLKIISPLDVIAYARPRAGLTRPAGVVYVDDDITVELCVTNTGSGPVAVTACAVPNIPAGMCLLNANGTAQCGSTGRDADTPPAMPLTIAPGALQVFTWTWSVGGWCTNVSGPISWNLYANGVLAKTPVLSVQPAPLAVSVTVWVDPDDAGPRPLAPSGTDPVTGEPGPVYYMGDEFLEERITYTNLSGTDTISLNPYMQNSLSPYYMNSAGPALPVSLAPGAQTTLTWRFQRDPAQVFSTMCQSPSIFGINLIAMGRGVNPTVTVQALPTPFTPSDPCPGGCAVSKPALLLAPVSAAASVPYAVTLELTNTSARAFRLSSPGAFSLLLNPGNTACTTITGAPGPGPYDWAPGQTRTFPFTVVSGCAGTQCYEGGVSWNPPPALCALTCNDGVPYCGSLDACTTVRPPGDLVITSFDVTPTATCDQYNEVLTVALNVKNTSGTDPVTVTRIANGSVPDSWQAGFAVACPAPPAPAVSPQPPLPLTINPGQTQLITCYMRAACGTTYLGAFSGESLIGGNSKSNPDEEADWLGGSFPKVIVTTPAFLWCDVATAAKSYSTGQVITVLATVENQGEDDLNTFGLAVAANGTAGVSSLGPPTPVLPATLPGKSGCLPNPPYPSHATYAYQFAANAPGAVVFTITTTGVDPVCALPVTASASFGPITVIAAAQLSCSAQATPVVTMSATCPGCALHGTCNPATGVGCIDVTMTAVNGGAVAIQNATPAHGSPVASYVAACPGPACPIAPTVLRGYPPEADVPGVIGALSTVTYGWTYSPTGTGCARVHTEFNGTDAGSKGALYCDAYTNCIDVLARYPLELRLTSVPSVVAPGQEFSVGVRVCNPGQTPAGLQNGEPALQFTDAATGAVLTDEYAVYPPPAEVLAPGECRDLVIPVTASRHASATHLKIRVARGDLFIARDAATGLPFFAADLGGPADMTMTDGRNLLEISGPNPFHPGSGPAARIVYQVSAAGPAVRTKLALYTLSGETVITLVDKPAETERAEVVWDGTNASGQGCASGVYLVRLECAGFVAVKKLAVIR